MSKERIDMHRRFPLLRKNIDMKTETISFLKKNAANLKLDEGPMAITQNGVPAYVIESYSERQRRDEAIALLKLLSFSRDDSANGRVISSSDLKQKLAKRRNQLSEVKHDRTQATN